MAAPTNTATTLVSIGNREDLEDVIYRVAPEETPFMSNIGKCKVKAVNHEWQTETLATPSATNAQLEGDDTTSFDAPNLTARVGNYCQIVKKSYVVSGTQEVVDKAGRASELARQKVLKGIEGRRDVEARMIGNYASNAESGGTARKFGGALAWLTSNTSKGTGGTDGGFGSGVVAAAGNGTQRTFTEALLKAVMATAFNNGARPSQIYLSATQKQVFSGFSGIAQIRKDVGSGLATIVGAADVYVSDFGTLTAIPHPYFSARDALLIDPSMWKVGALRGWADTHLAVSGDNEKHQMLWEGTLVCSNEKASAVIRDLT
jgi:hypothetical protein